MAISLRRPPRAIPAPAPTISASRSTTWNRTSSDRMPPTPSLPSANCPRSLPCPPTAPRHTLTHLTLLLLVRLPRPPTTLPTRTPTAPWACMRSDLCHLISNRRPCLYPFLLLLEMARIHGNTTTISVLQASQHSHSLKIVTSARRATRLFHAQAVCGSTATAIRARNPTSARNPAVGRPSAYAAT